MNILAFKRALKEMILPVLLISIQDKTKDFTGFSCLYLLSLHKEIAKDEEYKLKMLKTGSHFQYYFIALGVYK